MLSARRTAYFSKDTFALNELLGPAHNRPGRRHVLSKEEGNALSDCAINEYLKGSALNPANFRMAMRRIANDWRTTGYKTKTPCAHTFRQFRAENRNIAVRNKTNQAQDKIDEENFEHVSTMEHVLQGFLKDHPDIGKDPNRFWNLDETCIDSEFGMKEKVIRSSSYRFSGYKASSADSGSTVRVTAVVATSCRKS